MFRRTKGRTEGLHRCGPTSPLGTNFTLGGPTSILRPTLSLVVKNWPQIDVTIYVLHLCTLKAASKGVQGFVLKKYTNEKHLPAILKTITADKCCLPTHQTNAVYLLY
jgi:hypothetical protein